MKILRLLLIIVLYAMPKMGFAEGFIPDLNRGASVFEFECDGSFEGTTIKVYYYVPSKGDIKKMKVQFVMHGVNRNADDYRDSWISKADQYGIVILAPMFDKENFPSKKYQSGNVYSKGKINKQEKLTYSQIDAIFTAYAKKYHLEDCTYNIYGHSAGAQFVHRFVMFYNSPYLDRAIAANAGTYTFPSDELYYPFGYKDIGGVGQITEAMFKRKLTILLADGDTKRDSNLNVSEEADRQGLNRWERGNNFFKLAKDFANQHHFSFSWQLKTITGSAHSNSKMAPKAADLLYGSNTKR